MSSAGRSITPQPLQPQANVLPFRWILPLGQLVLSTLLFAIAKLPLGSTTVRDRALEIIYGLNLPACFIQIALKALRANQQYWTPPGMSFQTWSAIISPVFGMVFWWMAGRALEALVVFKSGLRRPKINGLELNVGFLVMLFGVMIL